MLRYAANPSTPLTALCWQFLHNELPVRVAKRVWDLRRLPHGLATVASMQTVRDVRI